MDIYRDSKEIGKNDANDLHRRKSKRKSSSVNELIQKGLTKSLNLTEGEVLNQIAELQDQYLSTKNKELSKLDTLSMKLATNVTTELKNLTCAVNQTLDKEISRKYGENATKLELIGKLTLDQQATVINSAFNEDFIFDHLKKMKQKLIENEHKIISKTEEKKMNKMLSRVSTGAPFNPSIRDDSKTPNEILIKFFTS